MTAQESYRQWLSSPALSEDERAELQAIENDPKEIEERFFAPLEFGTGGLRGIMQTGLHRMNRHIIRRTTQAMAELVLEESGRDTGSLRQAKPDGRATHGCVAVCYDTRNNSEFFAREAACVLAGNGITVRLFSAPRPTPHLSFAILHYGCIAGINITASHNPKQYNGYKAYWSDGAQMPPQHADVVARERDKVSVFEGVKTADFDEAVKSGLIIMLGEETDRAYLDAVFTQSLAGEETRRAARDMKLVYTPFHGCGRELVPTILRRAGFENVVCVPEQMIPDGNFPTVKSPNPENPEGFALAIELARREGADLIIGTDPDADRVGIVVRTGENGSDPDKNTAYGCMSGNQVGVLLLDYIIKARKQGGTMPQKPAFLKTIVTTPMAEAVALKSGVPSFDTFTGFKFLAEKIKELTPEGYRFIFAYEESYGYLAGDQARDKDAIVASMLIAEMAAYYKTQGMTLYDAMESLYEEYGRYAEETVNLIMPGVDGIQNMKKLMKRLREQPYSEIAGVKTVAMTDYLAGTRTLVGDAVPGVPQSSRVTPIEPSGSDVLRYELADGTLFLIRPSGTEPKLKVYILTKGADREECANRIKAYRSFAEGDLK